MSDTNYSAMAESMDRLDQYLGTKKNGPENGNRDKTGYSIAAYDQTEMWISNCTKLTE